MVECRQPGPPRKPRARTESRGPVPCPAVAPVPVIFDSDGGVDDAAALWWACTSPDIDVVAVTAVGGNVDVDVAARNLGIVLAAAGHDHVPVAVGGAEPIGPTPPLRRASAIHGRDGLGDAGVARPDPRPPVAEEAAGMLVRLVRERPAELTIVATGPVSNLAAALRAAPDLAAATARLIVMGGSARAGGNARPAAEANIAHDPVAASEVVSAAWPAPPLLVGLDVTHRATLSQAEFDLLEDRRSAAAEFLAAPLAFYRTLGSTFTEPGTCPCHDLLAMMAVTDADLVRGPILPLAVDTGGSAAWGATVVDFREQAFNRAGSSPDRVGDDSPSEGGRWRIGLEVDVDRFRANVRHLFGG